MRRLPFTGAAIAGAIMLIVGAVLPAQRFIGYGLGPDYVMVVERGSASFVQGLIGSDSWYRIEGGAVASGFAIAALVVAAIYAIGYHRALAFVVAMFGLAAAIAVLGTGSLVEYAPDTSFSANPAEGAHVSLVGATVLFLAPVAEYAYRASGQQG